MGIFDRFNGKPTISSGENINKAINDIERDYVSKSMHAKAKANNAISVGSLDVDSSDSTMVDKGSILQHKKLLRIKSTNIIVQSIIRTRTNQVEKYSRPARYSSDGVGFKILPKKLPKDGKLSSQKLNRIIELEEFIQNSGNVWTAQRGGGFRQFLSEFVYNRYVYDQINVELIRDSQGKLDHFNFVDAGTVVLHDLPKSADSPRSFDQYPNENTSKPIHFNENELTFVVYNALADVTRRGYGYSEVDASLSHLRFIDDTEDFNARFFAQGGTTRGLLLINSGSSAAQNTAGLNSLRQEWQSSFSGTNGAWKIPVVSAEDAKFINMTQTSKDMEFEKWFNFLLNIVSAIFQMQPDEINFPNPGGSTGKGAGNSINEGSTQKAKMKQSQGKGLEPLLNYIEDFINKYILREIDDDYYFRFTLGDTKDELQQQQVINQKLKNGMTLNEARKELGLEPLDSEIGDLPGDPATVVQFMQLLTNEDKVVQQVKQHSNDYNPDASDNGKPEEGMPVESVTDNNISSDDSKNVDNDNPDSN